MMDGVDLHMHTLFSDGKLSPAALVEQVHAAGIRVMAVTDHDSMDGVAAAQEAGEQLGIKVLPGVELSVRLFTREAHLLGYGIDATYGPFAALLEAYREGREERAIRMVDRLTDLGYPMKFADVEAISGEGAIGRPHVAQALVQAGHVRSTEEAFIRLIGDRGPAFQSRPMPQAADAIAQIQDAGGIAVLAHPGHWTSEGELRRLADAGLDGVEVIHPSHDGSLTRYYQTLARKYDLIESGGSDFHGSRTKDYQNLGRYCITNEQWQRIQARLDALDGPNQG